MSVQGIIVIDVLGFGFILLLLNLLRTRKLHVAYAVVWFVAVAGMMVLVSVPPLLDLLPRLVGAIFPASVLSLFAFVFIFLVLIFFSVQLSIISTRQVALIQALAVSQLLAEQSSTAEPDSSEDS
jgi:hypothetical protein